MPKQWVSVNLTGGLNTDSNVDGVDMVSANNMVSDPDGKGMRNREGMAVFQRVNQQTTPAGGIAVVVNSRVPNWDDGDFLVTCSNTSDNNRIQHMALTRPRSNIVGESMEVRVFFRPSLYYTRFGSTVDLTVIREGSLSRQVRVDYATVNGSAIGGTDFTAATGTLTFAQGETSKTITITTLAASQTTDKSFTVNLTGASTGVVLSEPRIATITCQVLSLISSFGQISVLNSVWPIYLYNPIAGRCTAHYLNINASIIGSQQYGGGAPIVKVAPNVICAAFGNSGSTRVVHLSLYSMSQIFSDGAAYEDGATSITLATKHSAYANVTLLGNSGALDSTNFRIVPYTEDEFFVVSVSALWRININTGAVVQKYPVPTHDPAFTTWALLAPSAICPRPFFGLDGDLYVYVHTMNATTVRAILKIDPDTGTITAFKTGVGNNATSMTGLADGNIIVTSGGSGAVALLLPADLSTVTTLTGTYGQARTGGIASGASSWLSYNDDSSPFSFRKFSFSGSNISTDFTYPAGPPFNFVTGNTISFQMGMIDSANFAARFGNNNTTNKVGIYKLADGTAATGFSEIDQEDFYGAEAISGSLFNSNSHPDFYGNDQSDLNLYYLRQIAGLMT